jgi:hypothetical protein
MLCFFDGWGPVIYFFDQCCFSKNLFVITFMLSFSFKVKIYIALADAQLLTSDKFASAH